MRLYRYLVLAAALFVWAGSTAVRAQEGSITLKTHARRVVVDVVVTDSKGDPVTDLKQSDFTVLEDGKAQDVRSFEGHGSDARKLAEEAPSPARNEYSNRHVGFEGGALNILLIDGLNTQMNDVAQSKQQTAALLKQLPPDRRVMVFVLGQRLEMVSNSGALPAQIAAALEKANSGKSNVLKSTEETRSEELAVADAGIVDAGFAARIQGAFDRSSSETDLNRLRITEAALRQIARVAGSYPGRKNLLWITAGFAYPTTLRENEMIDHTIADLAASHVAVYAIDAHGLDPIYMKAEQGSTGQGNPRVPRDYSAAIQNESDQHDTLLTIAQDTGGKAFYNSNALGAEIRHALELGTYFYTLTYTPSNRQWNGQHRKIEVKLNRPGLRAEYRRGYYAVPDDAKVNDKRMAEDVEFSMQPAAGDASGLRLTASIVQRNASSVTVRYVLPAGEIATRDESGAPRDLNLDFVAVAWNAKGKESGHKFENLRLPSSTPAFSSVEKNGAVKTEVIEIGADATELRVGVLDRNSGHIAALSIPLAAEAASQN